MARRRCHAWRMSSEPVAPTPKAAVEAPAVPPEVLRLARRRLAAGERLEMSSLAAELGVNRVRPLLADRRHGRRCRSAADPGRRPRPCARRPRPAPGRPSLRGLRLDRHRGPQACVGADRLHARRGTRLGSPAPPQNRWAQLERLTRYALAVHERDALDRAAPPVLERSTRLTASLCCWRTAIAAVGLPRRPLVGRDRAVSRSVRMVRPGWRRRLLRCRPR
jgi:hypothetical protein